MKMTLTYRAGTRDSLGLKNQIESLYSFHTPPRKENFESWWPREIPVQDVLIPFM